MGIVSSWISAVRKLLDFILFTAGGNRVTIWTLLYLLVLFVLFFVFSRIAKKWLSEKVLTKSSLNPGARMALATIIRYFVIFIGVVIILQNAGINLTALRVLAGTVGIGLGFGLQNIANNFISGIIILFERHIMVGDRIEVGGIVREQCIEIPYPQREIRFRTGIPGEGRPEVLEQAEGGS